MMFQAYLLTISYLLMNAGILLGDEYGGQYLLLLRLRNTIRNSIPIHIVLIIVGLLLAAWNIAFPIPPGPVLLGDFFPIICLLILVVYHIKQLGSLHKTRKNNINLSVALNETAMFDKTGTYIEKHKRNLGYFMLGVSIVHFLFPSAVLL